MQIEALIITIVVVAILVAWLLVGIDKKD